MNKSYSNLIWILVVSLLGCGDDEQSQDRFMIRPGELNPKYADSKYILVERPPEGCPVGPLQVTPRPCTLLSYADSVFVARINADSLQTLENTNDECRGEDEGFTLQVEVVTVLWGEPVPNLLTIAVPSVSFVDGGYWSEYAIVKTMRFKGYTTSFGSYAATIGSKEEIDELSSWGPTLPRDFDRIARLLEQSAQTTCPPPERIPSSFCTQCYACDPPREPYVTPYCQRPGNADELCCRDDLIMCDEE